MNFREYDQEQGQFIAIDLSRAIEEDHPARIINDIVESLDLSKIYDSYSDEGNPSYHPKMMLKVLFYCYMIGVFSCRKIWERLEEHNLPLLYLSGGNIPSYSTINNFRRRHLDSLPKLFTQLVLLCIELGMVDFGFLAIDGQKIHANASFRQSKTEAGLRKEIIQLENQMKELLERGPEEAEDDITGKQLKLENRKKKVETALRKLTKIMKDEKDEKKKKKMRINVTDNDSPVMTHKDGTKKPSYETYAGVDSMFQIITSYDCPGGYNEVNEAIPLILQSKMNCGNRFHDKSGLDAGFSSLENLLRMEELSTDVLMPDRVFEKWAKDDDDMEFHKSKFTFNKNRLTLTCPLGNTMKLISTRLKDSYTRRVYRGACCEQCPEKEKCTKGKAGTVTVDSRDELQTVMREKLTDEEGKNEYKKRMYTVEPIFGNMQKNNGWRQFHLRGEAKAKGEFGLHCIAHNLKKIVLHFNELKTDFEIAIRRMVLKYSYLY